MPDRPGHHHRHRFPAEIIARAVWLYHRFALSLRDVEELLYERGITVSYETVRARVAKFGARYAAELRKRAARPGRTWHLDEVFTRVGGRQAYLWRAVDEHGQVLDVLVQERRDTRGCAVLPPAAGARGWAAGRDRDRRPRELRGREGAPA